MTTINCKTLSRRLRGAAAVLLLVFLAGVTVFAQSPASNPPIAPENPNDLQGVAIPANGSGVMVGGELWESYMPANKGPYYGEASRTLVEDFIRMGNFDRAWSTPTHMWPGGWNNGNFWSKDMNLAVWDPDANFNPKQIGGKDNPSYVEASGSHYAMVAYANKTTLTPPRVVLGAGDPARDYTKETYWVDAGRHHARFEAGWPTTVGVDVVMTVDQYSLNWNNFNDFITVTLKLTNTGNVDLDADGQAEITNHAIAALALLEHGEFMCSYTLGTNGGRGNEFGATRAQGYIGDNDPKGNPWDITVGFPGESVTGLKDMGLNDFPRRYYTDIWSGWSWLGVKDANGQDKQTIFGTHPIGSGPERGWYTSAGQGRGLSYGPGNPRGTFVLATGTWYVDGGKSRSSGALNLAPNPNFFSGGTAENITTFVKKASPSRPDGDRKLLSLADASAFEVKSYEDGWTKGYTGPSNFDGDMFSGIGPFSMAVGETITVTWVEVGGYRLAGIQNAMAAARYVYENGDAVAMNYPAVPEMRVDSKSPGLPQLRWDNKAETDPGFAGYKIYRASQAIPLDWSKGGMRLLDDYWKNMTPGPTPATLAKPMNPNFGANDFIANRIGAPDGWGPYDLIKVVPKGAELNALADASAAGYNYSWADPQAPMGLKFWYYVAAYTNTPVSLGASYSGSNPATTSFLETSNINRNGASGLWVNTYPFATLNGDFPKTAAGLKNIGAAVAVDKDRVNTADLASGAVKVTVKPNPYRQRAIFDNRLDAADHRVIFYNMPATAKITILDVAGQVIQVLNFTSSGPTNGTTYWNLFSKNGIEVASGLYIYVVEYDGGKQVGYFSILR